MSHPATADLLELHFGELEAARAGALSTHVAGCAACRALLADVAWAEEALQAGPDEAPPADGLARVQARIEALPPSRRARRSGAFAALPCAAALLAGLAAVHAGGMLAALAFFAVGSMVTLSLAPVLILESQRRSR